jgi:phosphoribosylaminoimidazole-succinocarboxamide synthase
MAKRRRIYEGKDKILYEGPEPGTMVMSFKDDVTAHDGNRSGTITGKGVLSNRISEFIMMRLQDLGIPTHFVRRLNMREQLIREVEIIPLELVIRNTAAGEFAERFGIQPGTPMPRSIVEYYYKSSELGNPMVSEEHITAFGWAAPQDIDDMLALALRVNDFLSGLFVAAGLRLVDFRTEFGRMYEETGEMRVVLADEISPDTCRIWDVASNEPLDSDRFDLDLGRESEAYQEIARRLGILPEGGTNDIQGPEIVQ